MDSTPVLIVGAGTVTVLGQIARGETPSARVFIGTAGAGLLVILAAMAAPDLAHGFALVVFLTAILTSGYDVAHALSRAL